MPISKKKEGDMKTENQRQRLKREIRQHLSSLRVKIFELSRAQYVYGLQQKKRKPKK